MHAKEFVEIAVAVAENASELLAHNDPFAPAGFLSAFTIDVMDEYCRSSESRFGIWEELFLTSDAKPFELDSPAATTMFSLSEEILVSEILTRIWAKGYDDSFCNRTVFFRANGFVMWTNIQRSLNCSRQRRPYFLKALSTSIVFKITTKF